MKIKNIKNKSTYYKHIRFLSYSILSISATIVTGCASNAVNQLTKPQGTSNIPYEVIVSSPAESSPIVDSLRSKDFTIDDMIDQAEFLCATESYKEADSLLKAAIISINKTYGDSGKPEDQENLANYTNAVTGIYAELMPPEYLTDEISRKINQTKLLESIDSIALSDSDTVLQLLLKCVADTKFDVPVTFNERVQKACMYYLRKNRTTVTKWINRSAVYVPTMKAMFADSGLPLDLVYLPLIESGFNPKAYSRAHASGIWQFIPSTGKLYGLRNNYWLDERRDPLKATRSAVSYLKKLYNDFGNWQLALGAYNCGEGGMARAISKAGVADYWKLKLPKETMNYVPLYLASLIIIKNTERFGFDSIPVSAPLQLDTVTLDDCIDMGEIAKGINIDKDTLQHLNPHLLHWCTPPDMTAIRLYLPAGTTTAFHEFYSTLPAEKKVKWYRYRISSGDNLLTIAKKFRVSIDAIKTVNRIKNNRLIAGHYIFIPIPVNGAMPRVPEVQVAAISQTPKVIKTGTGTVVKYNVKKGDTFWGIADLFSVDINELYQWNGITAQHVIKENETLIIYQKSAPVTTDQKSLVDYKVNQGDNPYSIAKAHNMSLEELITINGLDKSNPALYAGETIKVSGSVQDVSSAPKQKVDTPDGNEAVRYRVQHGDNLFKIAKMFDMNVADLRSFNGFTEQSIIKIGDIISIPSQKSSPVVVSNSAAQNVVLYEVKPGDNLWRIAVSFGIPVEQLYTINNLTPDSVLMPGDVIKVSKAKSL